MEHAATFSLAISLLATIWLLVAWKGYWVAELRDALFDLRSKLFLYAADHDFIDTDAHHILRDMINSLTRYAHHLTFPRYIAISITAKILERDQIPESFRAWEASVNQLPLEQSQKVWEFRKKMGHLIIRHLWKTSMLLRIIILAMNLWEWLSGRGDDARKAIARRLPTQLIEEEALISG